MKTKKIDQIEEQVKSLKEGQVMLVSAREVNTEEYSGYQLQFAEKIVNKLNPLAMFNPGDPRYQLGSIRRGWQNFNAAGLKAIGVDLSEVETEEYTTSQGVVQEVYPIGVLNPELKSELGAFKIRLKIVETTPSFDQLTTWQKNNVRQAFKQDSNGNYLLKSDNLILSQVQPVPSNTKPEHVLIQHDSTTKEPEEYLFPNHIVQEEEQTEAEKALA